MDWKLIDHDSRSLIIALHNCLNLRLECGPPCSLITLLGKSGHDALSVSEQKISPAVLFILLQTIEKSRSGISRRPVNIFFKVANSRHL